MISIPPRSDLNDTSLGTDELTPSSFQSRHGLIWTRIRSRDRRHYPLLFQSRHGLIWTKHKIVHRNRDRGNFNPATVWFELQVLSDIFNPVVYFNPATVWFEHRWDESWWNVHHSFQSRHGLIWTCTSRSRRYVLVWFQSRHGLIWTSRWHLLDTPILYFNPATVWFELSYFIHGLVPQKEFQSRHGLIWTIRYCVLYDTIPDISIPPRSDLN